MDPTVELLFQAISDRNVVLIVSVVLISLVAYIKYVTEKGNLKGLALDMSSVFCSYTSGVALLLPAVDIWWYALLGSLFNPLTSNGLRKLGVLFVKWLNKYFSKKK